MSDYDSTSDLNEIIYYEKLDADMEQAQFEAEGNRYARQLAKVEHFIEVEDFESAVKACPHGHVGKLTGTCSLEDPRYMEEGYRCFECGGVVDEIHGNVVSVR